MLSALPDATGTSYVLTEKTAKRVREKLASLDHLDHYIVGIGSIDVDGRKRSAGATRTSHEFNAIMWTADGAVDALKDAAGECTYQPYRKDGSCLFDDTSRAASLTSLRDKIEFFPLLSLRSRARSNANVIAVAGGRHKVQAISTALTMELCNVLVTDATTAAAIVNNLSQSVH
jgi:DNA-binding transcriptional regulator LsrR (DeoR family)